MLIFLIQQKNSKYTAFNLVSISLFYQYDNRFCWLRAWKKHLFWSKWLWQQGAQGRPGNADTKRKSFSWNGVWATSASDFHKLHLFRGTGECQSSPMEMLSSADKPKSSDIQNQLNKCTIQCGWTFLHCFIILWPRFKPALGRFVRQLNQSNADKKKSVSTHALCSQM